jgi:hypothetical protein
MQNWNEPETSTIYLANGEQARAVVNGFSPEDGRRLCARASP